MILKDFNLQEEDFNAEDNKLIVSSRCIPESVRKFNCVSRGSATIGNSGDSIGGSVQFSFKTNCTKDL